MYNQNSTSIYKSNSFSNLKSINASTVKEMAQQSGLDFTVVKQPLKYNSFLDPSKVFESPTHVALVRIDTNDQVGVMRKRYGLIPYADMLEFTEVLIDKNEASYVYGGYTGRGEQAWVVMKTDDYVDLGGNDRIYCYFYVRTSHDGSVGLEVIPSPLREHNNTVIIPPLEWGKKIKIKHTTHAIARLAKAKNSLQKVKTYWEQFEESFKLLSRVKLTPEISSTYMQMIAPDSESERGQKKIDDLRFKIQTIYTTSPSCKLPSTHQTLLGLYFAVVEFYDHHTSVRKRMNLDEKSAKVESLLAGNLAERKARAYATALRLEEKFGGLSFGGN